MDTPLIDNCDGMHALLDELKVDDRSLLYLDLEGNNLSRHGTLSLVTIHDATRHTTTLVDVTTLGKKAFNTASTDGQTLGDILESSIITKVFFDIRNDSDALYALYGIAVQGIEDLQLMELASRSFQKRYVNGLAKCIERDARILPLERRRWREVKEKGRGLFAPELGGTYAAFDARPLDSELKEYCIQDVTLMPHLRELYREKLCDGWWEKIEQETKARIVLSQSPIFNGKGRHMAEGPRDWIYWRPTTAKERARTFLEPKTTLPLKSEAGKASPGPDRSADLIAHALKQMNLRTPDHQNDSKEEAHGVINNSDCDFSPPFGRGRSPDYTACGQNCGYCGNCDY